MNRATDRRPRRCWSCCASSPARPCSPSTQTEQVLVAQFGEVVRVDRRARTARQAAVGPERHHIRQAPAGCRTARRGSDPGRPAPADRRQLHGVPHHRPAALLPGDRPDPGEIRGRLNSVVTGSLRRVLGNEQAAGCAVGRPRADHGRRSGPGEHRDAELRRHHRGRAHPPRRPAGGKHPGHPVAHAVGTRSASPPRPAPRAPRRRSGSAPMPNASARCWSPTPRPPPTSCAARARREATKIYAKAFGQDPAFFSIWRTLQGYRDIVRQRQLPGWCCRRTTTILQVPAGATAGSITLGVAAMHEAPCASAGYSC